MAVVQPVGERERNASATWEAALFPNRSPNTKKPEPFGVRFSWEFEQLDGCAEAQFGMVRAISFDFSVALAG